MTSDTKVLRDQIAQGDNGPTTITTDTTPTTNNINNNDLEKGGDVLASAGEDDDLDLLQIANKARAATNSNADGSSENQREKSATDAAIKPHLGTSETEQGQLMAAEESHLSEDADGLVPPPLPLETTALRRGQNVTNQQAVTPGAYRGGPGEGLQRNDALQYSNFGVPAGDGPPPLQIASAGGTRRGDTDLVEANPVLEDTPGDLEDARLVDLVAESQKREKWKKQKTLFAGLLALLCATAAVTAGVVGGTRQNKTAALDTTNSTVAPTPTPTPSPTRLLPPMENLQVLYEDLPEGTKDSLYDSSAPQRMAWDWLLRHQNITHLEEWRKKQIFAMATFFYAFEGPSWPEPIRKDWLNDTQEECSWINTDVQYVNGLASLYLKSTAFDFNPCNDAGELHSIFLLALQLGSVHPTMPPEISLLSSLSVLGLLACSINAPLSDIMPLDLIQLPNLELIVFQKNEMGGTMPEEVGQMTALKHLLIGENKLTGTIPHQIAAMGDLTQLILDQNDLTGAIPSELGVLPRMTDLTLNKNDLTGTIPSELGSLGNLIDLSIYDNYFDGNLPTELGLLSNLKIFTLQDNSLSGTIPVELGMMAGVTQLHLSLNSLTGQLPTELGLMTNMEGLGFISAGLNGTIPSELGMLTSMTSLWLDENSLTGSIPSDIGSLSSVVQLALQNNSLSGPIPSELWQLTKLKQLDLSHLPLLSGTLPEELCYLRNTTSCDIENGGDFIADTLTKSCFLEYDCSDVLCGCDCMCTTL